ncbi:hypothetical protein B0H14DRAFT_3141940 [Mycena olivaceomarginata]|nr:hypothetical protein B0H14DRAFT_3141940 [Mycena olivaceomarginata]
MPRWIFIGSTRFLTPGQCQNDVSIGPGQPHAPVAGDRRLIIQQDNLQLGIAYVEEWMLMGGNWDWTVRFMPPAIVLVDRSVNANVPVVVANLAAARITNPRVLGNAPSVTGYRFIWGHDLELTGGAFRYVRHERRTAGQLYQVPFNPSGPGGSNSEDQVGTTGEPMAKTARARIEVDEWGKVKLSGPSQASMAARYHRRDFKEVLDVTQTVKRH